MRSLLILFLCSPHVYLLQIHLFVYKTFMHEVYNDRKMGKNMFVRPLVLCQELMNIFKLNLVIGPAILTVV
jgi:hypothetical protein